MKPLTIMACIMSATVPASAASAPSVADVQASIKERGATAVVTELWRNDQWNAISDQIARGAPEWLALVPVLATGADGGPSEDLGIDLALALPINPAAVLRITDEARAIRIERVCGRPFIENTEPKDYRQKALRAVRSVAGLDIKQKKQACLGFLMKRTADSRKTRP